jgi:hypothetical protein
MVSTLKILLSLSSKPVARRQRLLDPHLLFDMSTKLQIIYHFRGYGLKTSEYSQPVSWRTTPPTLEATGDRARAKRIRHLRFPFPSRLPSHIRLIFIQTRARQAPDTLG